PREGNCGGATREGAGPAPRSAAPAPRRHRPSARATRERPVAACRQPGARRTARLHSACAGELKREEIPSVTTGGLGGGLARRKSDQVEDGDPFEPFRSS